MKAFEIFWKAAAAILVAFVMIAAGPSFSLAAVIAPEVQAAVETGSPDKTIPVIITFAEQVNVKSFKDKDKHVRRVKLVKALKSLSESSQKSVREMLKAAGMKKVETLWILNGFASDLPPEVILELAKRPEIAYIYLNATLKQPEPVSTVGVTTEWNLDMVRAPELWARGYRGAGVVVAGMDTGVDLNHPDLQGNWRGGSNSWFDPNGEHVGPYDADGHGTQTMGVLVGGSTGGTAIGMAPDAKWIAVKIFSDSGSATLSGIHQGFQWLLDPDGNPLTDDAPDVVNNSWGFEQNPDQCITEFQADIQVLKTAGIALTFSAGNAGYGPGTSISPANYPESFAVGSVDSSALTDLSSSRGPSACDGSVYPELVAPGVNIKTADLTFGGVFPNSYAYVSGTSFSAPHVAGAMALLMSAVPGVSVSELEIALEASTLDLGSMGPDNVYGYGLLDAVEAYNLLSTSSLCMDLDGDGYYSDPECSTAADCNDQDGTVYPGAPEIKHDGIDQDCNGYDLTIDVVKALYQAKKDTLSVEATSDLGAEAALELLGYGSMKWNRKNGVWSITVRGAGGNPATITVRGIEGYERATTTEK